MTTNDRINIDPAAAAAVIEAAERLIDTYTLDMQDASIGDIITHLHLLQEDIHALARAIAVYRVATDPPASVESLSAESPPLRWPC